jgi:hypothetical protein
MKWERQLEAANVPREQWVKRVLEQMEEGGNLRKWAEQFEAKTLGGYSEDTRLINNWTWRQLIEALKQSNLWKDVEPEVVIENLQKCTCDPEGDESAIVDYVSKFQNLRSEAIAYGVYDAFFTEAALATQLFRRLPQYFRVFMNRRRSPGSDQQLRYDIAKTIEEIRQTQKDDECRTAMLTRSQPATDKKLVGAVAQGDRPPTNKSERIGKPSDYIAFFTSTAAEEAIRRAMATLQARAGDLMAHRVRSARLPGQFFIMITHPQEAFLAKLPDNADIAPLKFSWAGRTTTPRLNSKTPTALAAIEAKLDRFLQATQLELERANTEVSVEEGPTTTASAAVQQPVAGYYMRHPNLIQGAGAGSAGTSSYQLPVYPGSKPQPHANVALVRSSEVSAMETTKAAGQDEAEKRVDDADRDRAECCANIHRELWEAIMVETDQDIIKALAVWDENDYDTTANDDEKRGHNDDPKDSPVNPRLMDCG